MPRRVQRNGTTAVDVLVVIVVVGLAMSLLMCYLSVARAAARRTTCTDNMKQIGLAFQKYTSSNNYRLPGSAEIRDKDGEKTVGGWSFHVKLLPYMDHADFYNALDLRVDAQSNDPKAQKALQTSVPEFVCPSNRNPLFASPKAAPPSGAVTNYKGMGATCQQSLAMATGSGKPPYGSAKMHPDGVLFPTSRNIRMADITDGLAYTVLCAETVDTQASRWTVGREAALVGLPNAILAGAELDRETQQFFAPTGFDDSYGSNSAVSKAGLRTFLGYDFQGKDAGKYEDAGFGTQTAAYGPSSFHPGVVNHLLANGSVLPFKTDIDPALYMFLITRGGNDPSPIDAATSTAPIKGGDRATTKPVRGEERNAFEEPGLFSVESPEAGYGWRKVQDLKAADAKGAIYACTKEGSRTAVVLNVQFRKADGDVRATMIKAHYNGLVNSMTQGKVRFLEAKRPSLESPVPDKVPFSFKVQAQNGATICLYCLSVFGRNTYLIQVSAPTDEQAKKFFEAVSGTLHEPDAETTPKPEAPRKADAKTDQGTAPKPAVDPYRFANVLLKQSEYDKAISAYTDAIRIYPKYAYAYYGRGLAYGAKGRFDEAIADHTEALRLDPKLAMACYRRGLAYQAKGERSKAEQDFERAKKLGYKQ